MILQIYNTLINNNKGVVYIKKKIKKIKKYKINMHIKI